MSKKDKQWEIIEKAKKILIDWSKDNDARIYTIHFIPMFDFSLEVYVFYESDNDVLQNLNNGISDNITTMFNKSLSDLGYMKYFSENIKFVFDSHENVVNNYEGSYFFRLR
ncbi:hypothetical protein [Paenibacillus beijingensis]|uniref:Uncharacterized protein n=1 Tax=Paenibacillus beijingensis TaxID=1126833 RepID=A0A0D5NG13_9BACL|nr:hypothetical protein [Paenibacillus beijingensis]AJY73853.1 hypothetical protein VN24_03525 [Paenibacillus beijingensis]